MIGGVRPLLPESLDQSDHVGAPPKGYRLEVVVRMLQIPFLGI